MQTLRQGLRAALLLAAWQAGAQQAGAQYVHDTQDTQDTQDMALLPVAELHPAPPAVLVPGIVVAVADPAGFDSKPVSSQRLARLRGGAGTVNNMQLSGTVSSNTAVNIATGANSISAGSFSNASGLPIAIQNSGANVLIQNATIINIQMQ